MNSDHAPTAEEQLPPIADTFGLGAVPVADALRQRTEQLLAALRENREMKQRLDDEELVFSHANEVVGKLEVDCAEKDAQITQLAQLVERMAETSHGYFQRADAASAKLRAVSDAIEGRLEGPLGARIRAIVEGK